MEIREKMKCSKCHAVYKGTFKMNLSGDIECLDCDDKRYYAQPVYLEATSTPIQREVLKEQYTNMLLSDVSKVYRITAKEGEDYTSQFYTPEGTINVDKLYYHDNQPDLVFDAHLKVLECLKRLEKKETLFQNHNKIIETYFNLRNKKFTALEIKEAREILYDNRLEKGVIIE